MATKTKNVEEKEFTIKWFVVEDKLIKFEEEKTPLEISDAVAEFNFESVGIENGSKVKAKIDRDLGDNGTVVFMSKSTGKTKTEELSQKEEKQPMTQSDKKTLTVAGVSFKTKAITFEEEKGTWYTVGENVGVGNLKKWGIEKGVKVEIPQKRQKRKVEILSLSLLKRWAILLQSHLLVIHPKIAILQNQAQCKLQLNHKHV